MELWSDRKENQLYAWKRVWAHIRHLLASLPGSDESQLHFQGWTFGKGTELPKLPSVWADCSSWDSGPQCRFLPHRLKCPCPDCCCWQAPALSESLDLKQKYQIHMTWTEAVMCSECRSGKWNRLQVISHVHIYFCYTKCMFSCIPAKYRSEWF